MKKVQLTISNRQPAVLLLDLNLVERARVLGSIRLVRASISLIGHCIMVGGILCYNRSSIASLGWRTRHGLVRASARSRANCLAGWAVTLFDDAIRLPGLLV